MPPTALFILAPIIIGALVAAFNAEPLNTATEAAEGWAGVDPLSPSGRVLGIHAACTAQLRIVCALGSNSLASDSGVRPA